MNKFRSLTAMMVLTAVFATCALAAYAQITSTTTLIWNVNETKAAAQTIGSAPAGTQFYIYASVYSYSTGEEAYILTDTLTQPTLTATTAWVNVTYPGPIPPVRYSGGHGTGAIS